jgi:hypothetical protein
MRAVQALMVLQLMQAVMVMQSMMAVGAEVRMIHPVEGGRPMVYVCSSTTAILLPILNGLFHC